VLPFLVIGLREGLEASLIVGIVAAFLRQRGQMQALRWVWLGVGAAVGICIAFGATLLALEQQLPQRKQEMLETVVALIAVVMVTYMIIFMAHHARTMKSDLERHAGHALEQGSVGALVVMAFLAVLREGFETSVFLLAAFQQTGVASAAALGATLGIAISVVLGYLIYRGGVRINLSRFFTATGFVLVLVAAGLVASAGRTAYEAGWITSSALTGQAIDLSWLVHQGSVSGSLLTGMFGLYPEPSKLMVAGYLLYAVPMVIYVLWPRKRGKSKPQPQPQPDSVGSTASLGV
jgi:high-affinity iron transporter